MKALLQFARESGHRLDLLVLTCARLHHAWKRRTQVSDQLYLAGIKVIHVILLVSFFIGMVVSFQTGLELSRIGQQDQIGTIVAVSMAREMGPFIAAIIVAATVGSALAAELGTMAVSEELAALEVMSVDAVSFLVVPRIIALSIMCPMLTVVCDAVGIFGGGFVANAQLHVGAQLYYDTAIEALQTPSELLGLPKDVYGGLFKAFIFGLTIAVVSCSTGMRATGGALGVGNATRQAVRDSIIAVIVFNYFITWFLYQ